MSSVKPFMTALEYAAHRGVSDTYVRRLRRTGRLVTGAGKLIDVAASDAMLNADLNPVRGGDRSAPTPESDGAVGVATVLPLPGGPSVHEAVRRERLARARLAELELGEQTRQLTRTKEVERTMFTLVRQALERLRSIPSRVRTQVAAESDPRECEALLDAEIRKVCADMQAAAEKLTQLDAAHGEGEAAT